MAAHLLASSSSGVAAAAVGKNKKRPLCDVVVALPQVPSDEDDGWLQWDAGPGGRDAKKKWKYFRHDIQDEVNKAYKTARQGGMSAYYLRFEDESGTWVYWLDFEEMTQCAIHSGFTRKLRWLEDSGKAEGPKPMPKSRHTERDWHDDCVGDKCLQWDAGPGGKPRWKNFQKDKQEEVDAAYRESQCGGKTEYLVRFDDDGYSWEYTLNFLDMVQVASHSGYVRRLRWWHPKD